VAALAVDLPILAVNVELGALVLADLATSVDGILFVVEVAAATARTVLFDVPSTVSVEYYAM